MNYEPIMWSIYDDDKYESQCTAPEEEEEDYSGMFLAPDLDPEDEEEDPESEAEVAVDRKLHEWIDEGKPEEEDIPW